MANRCFTKKLPRRIASEYFSLRSNISIPEWLFDDKRVLTVRLPFCPKNEEESKVFVRRLEQYTAQKFTFKIIWNTRNIRSLFPLKDKVTHRSCCIYEGTCSCGEQYIGETNRVTEIRWNEHSTPSTDGSDPSKHLHDHPITSSAGEFSHQHRKNSFAVESSRATTSQNSSQKSIFKLHRDSCFYLGMA